MTNNNNAGIVNPAGVIADLGRSINYHPSLVPVCGSVTATLMFCQLLYWTPRTKDPEGWFYKTQKEMQSETGLSRHEQDNARKKLSERKLIETKRAGVPPRTYYRVNSAVFNERYMEHVHGQVANQSAINRQIEHHEIDTSNCHEPANQAAINRQNITEITQETTPEITPKENLMSEVADATGSDDRWDFRVEGYGKVMMYDTEHRELAELLDSWVSVNSPKERPRTEKQLHQWSDSIRLMCDTDGHTVDEIREVINWVHQKKPHFDWWQNIRSGDKLRKQFGQLWDQMQDQSKPKKPKFEPSPGGYGIERALAFSQRKQAEFRERVQQRRAERERAEQDQQTDSDSLEMRIKGAKEIF